MGVMWLSRVPGPRHLEQGCTAVPTLRAAAFRPPACVCGFSCQHGQRRRQSPGEPRTGQHLATALLQPLLQASVATQNGARLPQPSHSLCFLPAVDQQCRFMPLTLGSSHRPGSPSRDWFERGDAGTNHRPLPPRHDLGHWAPSVVPSVPSGSPHTAACWAQPPELLWGGRLAFPHTSAQPRPLSQ